MYDCGCKGKRSKNYSKETKQSAISISKDYTDMLSVSCEDGEVQCGNIEQVVEPEYETEIVIVDEDYNEHPFDPNK